MDAYGLCALPCGYCLKASMTAAHSVRHVVVAPGRIGGAFAGNDDMKCRGICGLKYAVQDVDSNKLVYAEEQLWMIDWKRIV